MQVQPQHTKGMEKHYSPDIGDLDQFISAMANTSGGILVLGIGENHNNTTNFLIDFKEGFKKDQADSLNNRISTFLHRIEPMPMVTKRPLEEDNETFYMLLKVHSVIKNRPYMLKDKGQFYIRVGSTNQPASRETILNLFKHTIDRTSNIEILETTATMLLEQLKHISKEGERLSNTGASADFLPEIDLNSFTQAAQSCMWFLNENDLVTSRLIAGPERRHGFFTLLHSLQEVNVAIGRFNAGDTQGSLRNRQFGGYYIPWQGHNMQWIVQYLERLLEAAKTFLSTQP